MSDVIVVGAGLIGMLCARECALAGQTVTVLERGKPAREASWAGGGILSPLYPWRYPDAVIKLARWSQSHYATLCNELGLATGIDPEYTVSGLLVLDDDSEKARTWARHYDAKISLLQDSEITEIEPALAPGFKQAIWMPDVAQVRNPRFGKALWQDLENRGIDIRMQQTMTGLDISGDTVTGVITDKETVHAKTVIVAAGAWSGELLAKTGFDLPVEPVRGQMVLFKAEAGKVNHISLSQNHYVIPRRDGRVLAGSTLEYAGFDKTTTAAALETLHTAAVRLVPGLRDAVIEKQWAGLRPGSPRGIPYIGRHPSLQHLYINAGHFRNGVVLAPASARLMADICFGREAILPEESYLIE